MRRQLLRAAFAVCVLIGVLAGLMGLGNDLYFHDRRATGALMEWRRNPSPETERIWHEQRDRAMTRNIVFKTGCFGIVATCGIAGWRIRRALRTVPPKRSA